ncbi:MAG: hypothetical protein IKR59_07365, partial [Lachnospiraceae bacterium]|nr:hypothetical protein [Lachnospiraceae bacterium]
MSENSKSRGFAVMAKPVGSVCNLRCRYCYYLDAPQRTGDESQGPVFGKETARAGADSRCAASCESLSCAGELPRSLLMYDEMLA